MKTSLHLRDLKHNGVTFVESTFNTSAILKLIDTYTGNTITCNTNQTRSGYVRTNKNRETFVTLTIINDLVVIEAMHKNQYLDIDEYIAVTITIEATNYNKFSQTLQLYNYDYTTDIYMLDNTQNNISCAKFNYIHIPFSKDLYIFTNSNAINSEITFTSNSRLISNTNVFITTNTTNNKLAIKCNTINNNEISIHLDSFEILNIDKPIYLPEIITTSKYNTFDLDQIANTNDPIQFSFTIDSSKVSKFYKHDILEYANKHIVIEIEVIKDDGKKVYNTTFETYISQESMVFNYAVPTIAFTEKGEYHVNTNCYVVTQLLDLVHSKDIVIGSYIRYTNRTGKTFMGLEYIGTTEQVTDIQQNDNGYFLPIVNLLESINENRSFDLIPNTYDGSVELSSVAIDETENIYNSPITFLNNHYYDKSEYIAINYTGIVIEKLKSYYTKTNSVIIVNGYHDIIEKYQNVIEVISYDNISVEVEKLDDSKVFIEDTAIKYLNKDEHHLINLSDGIYNILISDLSGVYNYIYICYPSILNGNMKYLKDLLENIPRNPHATNYDFYAFITMKDLLMKKLNNMYANQYPNADITDDLLSDLYTFKQIVDNLKQYVPK